MAKKRVPRPVESEWIGQWVCVVLHDGSYYVGKVADINHGEVILHDVRRNGAMPEGNLPVRAQVSGLLSSLFGFGGNSGGSYNQSPYSPVNANYGVPNYGVPNSGGPNSGGMNWGKFIPAIRIGFNMMQTMMPLFGRFFI